MDENLKIEKKDIIAMKVEVVNQPEIKKDEPEIETEYFEVKIGKEDIDDIEVE